MTLRKEMPFFNLDNTIKSLKIVNKILLSYMAYLVIYHGVSFLLADDEEENRHANACLNYLITLIIGLRAGMIIDDTKDLILKCCGNNDPDTDPNNDDQNQDFRLL